MFLLKYLFRRLIFLAILLAVLDAVLVMKFPQEHLPKKMADAAVVLGAAPNSPAITHRTEAGVELMQNDQAKVLVLSGGRTSSLDESEAQNMQRVVRKSDPALSVILEGESSNTWENLQNTQKLLPEAESLIVVTDKYHLARSVFTAKAVGFEKVYWDSPDSGYYPKGELRRYYFREMTAMPWYVWQWLTDGNP